MEPVPLKYGKLAIKYPWIYGYFLVYNALQLEVQLGGAKFKQLPMNTITKLNNYKLHDHRGSS